MSTTKTRHWTDEQRELFELDGAGQLKLKRVAVLADAGSGKTSVLVERVKQLRAITLPEGVSRGRTLCVSFTERSAADLKERLSEDHDVDVHTIHGFCARILREFGSLMGLSPLWRILNEEDNSDLYYSCFEKVYRRNPPENLDHSSDQWFQLCRLARSACDSAQGNLEFEDPVAATFVQSVLDEYEHTKHAKQSFEYSDLERLALKLLENKEVRQVLHNRYRHVFIDEFQDTSELQCSFMNALIHPQSSLFVVGDSKQSIYRFRGADVQVFEKFVESLGLKRRLSRNFRSHPQIIEAVNQVCAHIIPSYESMVAGRDDLEAVKISTGLNVARFCSDDDAQGVLEILADLAHQGVPIEDIALLLPRLRGNESLLSKLREKGVGLSLGAAGGVLSNQSLRALCDLWIWACEPWQKLRAVQVLVDFMDCRHNTEALLAGLESPFLARPHLSCEELLKALDEKFSLKEKLGIYFQQFRLFVFHHQSRGLAPSALARQLVRLMAEGADVGGLHLLPPPMNVQGALRVMTVHGSKGLEFPVVILADLKGRKAKVQGPFLKKGSQIFIATRDDDGKLVKSDAFEQARLEEISAENLESGRLFYVAMTRAEKALFLVDRPDPEVNLDDVTKAKTKAKAKEPPPTWALWSAAHFPKAKLNSLASPVKIRPPIPATTSLAGGALVKQVPTYKSARLGVTALAKSLAKEKDPSRHTPELKSTKSKEQAASRESLQTLGTLVHECLEFGQWDKLKDIVLQKNLPFERFWQWLETPDGLAVFGSDASCQAYSEFAFEWKSPSGVVTGRIDRLVVWPERNEAWVIDYKVMLKPRSREEVFAEYQGQLQLYAEAIRSLTGFANTKAFLLDLVGSTGNVWHCLSE